MNGSVGQALREARVAKKLTIEEVARATKIRPERISDLEQDDYMRFPNIVYARNFLILYAKHLGVDISRYPTVEIGFDPGVSEYAYLQQEADESATPARRQPRRRRPSSSMPPEKPRWLIAFLIFLVMLAAGALIGWSIMTIKRLGPVGTPQKESATPTPSASPTPSATPTPSPTPAAPEGMPVPDGRVPVPVVRAVPVSDPEAIASPSPAPMTEAAASPTPSVVVAQPIAPVAEAAPEATPATEIATPVTEGEEMEVAIRSKRKIRLRVIRDDPASPSVYHGSLNPLMKKPLIFVGKHFWIKTADPDALEVTINGKPAPATAVEVIRTQGI